MDVIIQKSTAYGRVKAPPSKSMAHRYLICGALSKKSEIKGISFSKDIEATLNCLRGLGADIQINDNSVLIGGLDFSNSLPVESLFCNESGSTLRFLIPIALLFNKKITFSGTNRLFERSLSIYEEICNSQGLEFSKTENSITVSGRLSSGKYTVRGDISSQFISGLMFALSQLEGDSEINITGKCESASYLALTVKALADFGVRISRIDECTIYIKGSQSCKNRSISVEGDYSNAAFLESFNLFGGNVAVTGLGKNSAQGDRVYRELFELLNKGKPTIDVSDCPDLAPVLMAVAAAKNGVILKGTSRLRIKESDRGAAMQAELSKFGCRVTVKENEIFVSSKGFRPPTVALFGHNDHRIVMALSVLLTLTGGTIMGAQAVSKSYPDFFDNLLSLRVNLKVEK